MDTLRLSIATYKAVRHLIFDQDVTCRGVHTHHGIVAGSAFASNELTLYCINAITTPQNMHK